MAEPFGSPRLADVLDNKDAAAEYEELGLDSAGWNVGAHYPLLLLVRPDAGKHEDLDWHEN